MKKTLFSNGFMHSNAFIKASACLLLSTGIAIPVMASPESSGNASPTIVQQNTTVIKGSVLDAKGEPIIGASVVEKGSSSNGTITDVNGNYTLNIKRGSFIMKKIILLCSAGMSTSMLVQKMKDAAQKKGVDVTIKAVPVAEFEENIATADIVLLGPQVKYEQAKLQALADPLGKKVAVIDMMDYGMMKGDAVLDKALKLME